MSSATSVSVRVSTKRKQYLYGEQSLMSKAKSGVVLKNNRSASSIFHEVLSLVCDQIDPTPRLQEWLISADSFRKHYVSRLPEFEAHRLCSPQRHEIARQPVSYTHLTLPTIYSV